MEDILKSEDILEEIQFELAQGIIGKYSPGRSIHQVRTFSNQARDEILDTFKMDGGRRAVIRKQFQITEMLLKSLEELATSFQAMQLNFEKHYRATPPGSPNPRTAATGTNPIPKSTDDTPIKKKYFFLNQLEILKTIPAHHLKVEVPVSRRKSPWSTKVVNALKMFYHRPAYFYTSRLGEKQEAANQIFGDWLIKINTNNQHIFSEMGNIADRLNRLEKIIGAEKKPEGSIEVNDV